MRKLPVAILAVLLVPVPAGADAPLCTHVIDGTVSSADQNAYLLHAFDVPAGSDELRAELELTQPDGARDPFRYTLDMGLRDPDGRFRSWNHNPAVIRPDDRGTASSVPGPIPPGTWTLELGAAATIPGFPASYRVTITCSDTATGPDFDKPAYDPAHRIRTGFRWYAGDLHVHSTHSSDAPATVRAIAAEARRAGLDLVGLSDHNTSAQWLWLGEHQAADPDVLFLRSREVTTYLGHFVTHGTTAFPDYRAGPVLDGATHAEIRGPLDVNALFDEVHASGGLVQVAHPAFPPDPVAPFVCRGCGWDQPDTDWSKVDLIEIQTGPPGKSLRTADPRVPDGPDPLWSTDVGGNPFTPQAIALWERALNLGSLVAAVGGSDDHRAGQAGEGVTSAYLAEPTTMVLARDLSEVSIVEALRKRHVYVKLWGPDDPSVDLIATAPFGHTAEMGDVLSGETAATFTATVTGGDGMVLRYVRNGAAVAAVPVTSDDFEFDLQLPAVGPGWVRIDVGDATRPWVTVSNPIFLR